MYFLHNFYSRRAWDAWRPPEKPEEKKAKEVKEEHRIATANTDTDTWKKEVTFEPVERFDDLVEIVAFLQLMNKRHVLYFRGEKKQYDTHLPSIFRGAKNMDELKDRWGQLQAQSGPWRSILTPEEHPRQRTLEHYPQALWAVQQHYKDLLDNAGVEAASTPFIDVTHSLRVAAYFATLRGDDFIGSREQDAYVHVIALPQTTGSITFNADEQLQILRLSALCPPRALRPSLQEGYLVGRFPMPDPANPVEWGKKYWAEREELFSPRRRIVAIIPIHPENASFEHFWGMRGFNDADLLDDRWFSEVAQRLSGKIREVEDSTSRRG